MILPIVFFGYLFNPSGYNDYILSLKDYYNRIVGSLEPQQPPISGPVFLAEEHDEGVSAQADRAVLQESMTDIVERNSPGEGEEPVPAVDLKLIIPFNININELSPEAYEILDRLAAAMAQNRDIEIVVTGYTDTLGDYHYNKKLSGFRANIVKSYLVAKEISPLRIQAIGMGEESPLEPNTSAAGRCANRRVEIELHPGS